MELKRHILFFFKGQHGGELTGRGNAKKKNAQMPGGAVALSCSVQLCMMPYSWTVTGGRLLFQFKRKWQVFFKKQKNLCMFS